MGIKIVITIRDLDIWSETAETEKQKAELGRTEDQNVEMRIIDRMDRII